MLSSRGLLIASCLAVSGISAFGLSASAQTYGAQPGDLGYFVTSATPPGGGTRLDLYRLGLDGVATEMHQDIFPGDNPQSFSASDYSVNTKTGKIYFVEPPSGGETRTIRVWDIQTSKFEQDLTIDGLPTGGSPMFIEYPTLLDQIIQKQCISNDGECDSDDPTRVVLGANGTESVAIIDDEGLSVGGKSIVRREVNAAGEEELHIGENSLVTVESNGVQKMYATDASGKKIPINITEGSDLQINGVSVQGQINTNAAGIVTNTLGIKNNAAGIEDNRKDINNLQGDVKNLGSGIAGATALSAALSSLPATSDDSPFSCGVGTGGYSSRYAMGVGCAARINERLSFNAGGSVLFGGASDYGSGTLDTMAGRAGFVFKIGAITPSNGQSNEQLQSKLQHVETHNAEMAYQLESLQQRLNQLEALALGASKAESVATIVGH
jgi:hypothetical protein